MRVWLKGFGLPALLLLALAPAAPAREACPFLRDPAYWARNPVPPAPDGLLALGTLNAYRLFDDQDDRGESLVLTRAQFAARIERIARYVADDMGAPAVLALQEVEDATAVEALAAALAGLTGRRYQIVMGETASGSDIRNALLVDTRLQVGPVTSLFARTPRAGLPLHDRLPLVAQINPARHARQLAPFTVVVVHGKSMRGMERAGDESARVTAKRRHQAQELAAWAAAQARGGVRLVVLGDLNAPVAAADDARGEPLRILLGQGELVDTAPRFLKPSQRWTYKHRCALDQLDHVLVSPALVPQVRAYGIARGDTCLRARERCDAKRSVSDHEGVVVHLGPR